MKRALRFAAAACLSLATVAATVSAADAGRRERDFARGALAGVAGAIIVNGIARAHGPYHAPGYYEPSYAPGYYAAPRYVYARPRYAHVAPRRPVRAKVRRARQAGAHVGWCSARYRSYDSYSNTFQPYHGPRQQCVSPYL